MSSLHLVPSTQVVWSGDPVASVDFKVILPSNLATVKSANAALVLLSGTMQRVKNEDPKTETGKQIRMNMDMLKYDHKNPPEITFRSQGVSGGLHVVNEMNIKSEQLLCSYLNSNDSGDHFVLRTNIDLRELSAHINAFALQLEVTGVRITNDTNPVQISSRERSSAVKISKLKLCIQNNIAWNHVKEQGEKIDWYCKHGGENTSIDVMIHLKDEIGRIITDYPSTIPLKTELVYEDGTKIMPLSGDADRPGSSKEAYRPMRPEPCLDAGVGSCHFAFRIESVSQNHRPHTGFRLKVDPLLPGENSDVVGGLMEEIIVVKSRPMNWKKRNTNTFIGGRSTILQKAMGGIPVILSDTNTPRHKKANARIKKEKSNNPPKEWDNKFTVDTKSRSILFEASRVSLFFTGNTTQCLGCSKTLKLDQGLDASHHKPECSLFLALGPILTKSIMESSTCSI